MNEQCSVMERDGKTNRLRQCSNRATHWEEPEEGVKVPVCGGPHIFVDRCAHSLRG